MIALILHQDLKPQFSVYSQSDVWVHQLVNRDNIDLELQLIYNPQNSLAKVAENLI